MNAPTPRARLAPGRPAAATLGLIDVDIHPRLASWSDLHPWLSAEHRMRLAVYGTRPRHGYVKGPPYHKAQPLACRRDAWPPGGGTPASDPDFLRAQHLDHFGIDIGILNPLSQGQGERNNAFSAALCHATNEWQLAHWVARDPRLRASVTIPYEDPQASAAEIRLRGGDARFAHVLMMSRTAQPAGHPHYWPIYEAAAEVGLPVAFHAFGYSGHTMTNAGWPSYYIEEVSEHATSCQNLLTSLIVEGVFVRFPSLRVVLIECGFAWLPSLGWRLDALWPTLRDEVPHLAELPSETIRRHVWVSTQPIEEPDRPEQLVEIMGWIGWDRILYASDYPHWDFDDPRFAIPAYLGEERRAAIYGGNARALYGW
ncbi:MAG: amidohydrolase family protein [Rhodovarius sp.]|nr:amidohydrolase [Rhodovarius sp.]MDW8316101.1 amidohydrolase family protein [Rhodovarius sp.]